MYRLVRFVHSAGDVVKAQKDTVYFPWSDTVLGVAVI